MSAQKAKASDLQSFWDLPKRPRAARHDLTWRADELAEQDLWQRRTALPIRSARRIQ